MPLLRLKYFHSYIQVLTIHDSQLRNPRIFYMEKLLNHRGLLSTTAIIDVEVLPIN